MIMHAEASINILHFSNMGLLVQHKWRAVDGREMACLLGAIHPSVTDPSDCAVDLMPFWVAEYTVAGFDGIPASEIVALARRYGNLIGRWEKLEKDDWNRIHNRFLIYIVDLAVGAARWRNIGRNYWTDVEAACRQVKVALAARVGLRAAEAAAMHASELAVAAAKAAGADLIVKASALAAWAAAKAAKTAAGTARDATVAAMMAAGAAGSAVRATALDEETGIEVFCTARNAAYLNMFNFLLDLIEREVNQ